jgi:putative Holliday junction resolvase
LSDGATDRERRTTAEAAGTRVIGIDLGERRIGVSVSDSQRVLATPHSVIARSGDLDADHGAIAAVVSEFGAGLVVVGLPLSLTGDRGPAAAAAVAEASRLGTSLGVPVVLHDERLTTVEAERRRRLPAEPVRSRDGERARSQARPLRRSRPGVTSRARREGIDAVAATVLLQSWLEENRGKR